MGAVKDEPELAEITFHGGFVRQVHNDGKVSSTRPQIYKLQSPTNTYEEYVKLQSALDSNKVYREDGAQSFPVGPSPLKARRPSLVAAEPLYVKPDAIELKPEPKSRSTKLACLGIPSSILDKGSPAYSRCVRLASSYKKQRQKELTLAHGYVSSGVSALLAASSLALSASRFLYEIAAGAEIFPTDATPRGTLSMPQVLKLASSLSDSARQNELSAWELCARESVVFKRNKDSKTDAPWLVSAPSSPSGEVKRRPGRPRKDNNVEHLKVIEVEPCQNQENPE